MIRSCLLPPHLLVVRDTRIACFHGHVERCPVVVISLYYLGQPHQLQVARIKRLPYRYCWDGTPRRSRRH